jgi:Domain of Unknown Function (DUF928)
VIYKDLRETFHKRRLTMNRLIWLSLPLLVLTATLTQLPGVFAHSPSQAQRPPHPSALIAQAPAEFDRNMRQGYQATAKRDYRNALVFFRTAEKMRPGNRYASIAIANVNRYIELKQAKVPIFIASSVGAPVERQAGASRGLSYCLSEDKCLVALLPESDPSLLTTTSDYPSLLFYVSASPAKTLEFRFKDSVSGKTYTLSMIPPQKGGLVSVNLATLKDSAGKPLPPLVAGKTYDWDYTLVLDPQDRSNSPNVDGTIKRQELDPALAQMIQQASPQDRIALYGANRIWYDLIATLYQERLKNPNNPALASQWTEVLQAIKLDQFAKVPAIQ